MLKRAMGGLALALALGSAAQAQTPQIELRSSTWIESNYPEFARNFQLHGEAMLSCLPGPQRTLKCKVVSETPVGLGFGQAALDVAWGSRLKAGVVAKGPIAFPVIFDPVPILDRPLRTGSASPQAQALVDLVMSGFMTRRIANEAWRAYQAYEGTGLDRVPASTRTAAQAAMQTLRPQLLPAINRRMARALDDEASPDLLAAAVAYLKSDAGRDLPAEIARTADLPDAEVEKAAEAWITAKPERMEGLKPLIDVMEIARDLDDLQLSEELRAEMTPVLRRELCARIACHPKDMPAAAAPAP